jgi:hypothetical protein
VKDREARVFAAAQDDAETAAQDWPAEKLAGRVCRIENLAAGTRGEIELGTVCREIFLAEFTHPNASRYEIYVLAGYKSVAEMFPPAVREIRPQSISVNFGKVVGHKYIVVRESPSVQKAISYNLQIPGGYAHISINADFLFDEEEWNLYLATLRYEKPVAK